MEKLNSKNEKRRLPTWLILVIILILALISLMFIYTDKEPKAPQDQELTAEQKNEVFSYIGKITEIESDRIQFQGLAHKNPGLNLDALILALVSEQTKYIKRMVPKTLPTDLEPGQTSSLFSQQEITLTDLKIGDEITAISTSNIMGKTEFTANRIEMISVE